MSVKPHLLRFELGVSIDGKIDLFDISIFTTNKTKYTKILIDL